MTRRGRGAGCALALLYVAVAALTDRLSSRPILPVFDGFAPPTPYAWVAPPPERARDNVAPKAAEREFTLGEEGSPASNAATDDAQAIVGLNQGSVPPRPPDTAVHVRVTPVDAATLGPLPPGLRVVSNAYEVRLAYVPSHTPLPRLAVPGTIALTAAAAGDRMLFSPDGQRWQEREFRPFGSDHGVFTELVETGWFVVAGLVPAEAAGDGGGTGLVRGLLMAGVALGTIAAAALVVLLPSPVPAPRKGRPPAAKARPRGKKRSKRRR